MIIPQDVLVRLKARVERLPDKVVWVMFDREGQNWYTFADTKRVAASKMEAANNAGRYWALASEVLPRVAQGAA